MSSEVDLLLTTHVITKKFRVKVECVNYTLSCIIKKYSTFAN